MQCNDIIDKPILQRNKLKQEESVLCIRIRAFCRIRKNQDIDLTSHKKKNIEGVSNFH